MTDPHQGAEKLRAGPNLPRLLREFESRDLFDGQREILIRHVGEVYRLSITRSGKLILRK